MSMYGWYDPRHLLQTGVRVGIATIFGEFLDRRELFGNRDDPSVATLDPQHDYSSPPELWIDFVADSGDGWDSTYAVARLLARKKLAFSWTADAGTGIDSVHRAVTRPGHVLVFGGDQVYATASRDEYKRRFIAPFEQATRAENAEDTLATADVYAIPGNHDWYDGLNSFMGLFCARRPGPLARGDFAAGRRIGGRQSRQTRSYFALKLPGNWWLLAADAQLSGYLDRGQVAFFDDVAQTMMDDGSNVILCAGMPSWSYVGLDGSADSVFRNYSYLEAVVTGSARSAGARRHNLRLVLSGDSHHYARYLEGDTRHTEHDGTTTLAKSARCYLTWGGGGAFLHPTHQLEDVSFEWDYIAPPPVQPIRTGAPAPKYRRRFTRSHVYPSDKTSRRLSWRLPLFGWDNRWFTGLLFCAALIAAWTLAAVADFKGARLPESLRASPRMSDALWLMATLLLSAPWFLLACAAFVAVLTYFSAAQRTPLRWLVGVTHFSAHLTAFLVGFFVSARYLPEGTWPVWLVSIVALATAVLSSTIMGVYLWISLAFFRRHWNEAFSALRIKHYKGFLRLHLDRTGALTIYPIGLDTVPKHGEGPLDAKLIERPIRLSR
jgi:3',5'-cyclic AMP phosphodiesterase CpdA